MKKILLFFVVGSLFLSCTSNTIYEKPKDLIPKDSMVLLLRDLYIAAAAKNVKNKNLERKISYAPFVYDKYKIDSARFQRSNFYYTSKIDLYRPMLDQILVTLEEDRAEFNAIKKVQDSIRNDSLKKARLKQKKIRDSLGTKLTPKLEKTELKQKVDLKKVLNQ
jgi:hypothetical protein